MNVSGHLEQRWDFLQIGLTRIWISNCMVAEAEAGEGDPSAFVPIAKADMFGSYPSQSTGDPFNNVSAAEIPSSLNGSSLNDHRA